MILQDLGHIPHQDHQLAGLNDAVYLSIPRKPAKLDKLHQLITIILRIEPPGLSLRQRRHTQL
jgi:hypothetical protein